MAANSTRTIITLTTDFGDGPYAAQLKAVLLSRNPELNIVDVTHHIPAQDVRAGALVVDDVCRRFPPHTIHLAVVDPGVGTQRGVVFAQLGQQRYIAPDNGLLSLAARRMAPDLLISVTNRLYFLPEVTPTFQGRDIMAPVAAHLSLGLHPERLGAQLDTLVMLPGWEPVLEARRISGKVLYIDAFGNVITNLTVQHLAEAKRASPDGAPGPQVRIGGTEVSEMVLTYGEKPPGTMIALIGSNGRLELAIVNGNAAAALGVRPNDDVQLSF